jgi:predicted amidohydrolase
MRIALAQIAPTLGDLTKNLDLVETQARLALQAQADLVVFPELALTGYRLRDLVPEVALRLDQPSQAVERLSRLSQSIALVVGLAEESADHRFYNSAAYWSGGELLHVHRKCHLPTYGTFDEAMDFAAGDRLEAFDTPLGRFGILICEDAWHLAAATVLTQDGANLLLVPSVSPLRGLAARPGEDSASLWQLIIQATARCTTTPVIYVGRSGFEDGLAFAGESFAVGPGGELLGPKCGLDPELAIVELDPARTRAARAANPFVRDERPDLIARELGRIVARRHRIEEPPES